ncbi:CoA transferase [Deinococcus deserti]|uniref:Putative CoA-transferase n=1 Tax=Deinococcus deserti (strain DSM 17065 / CIP 109153 / LMG 22923 / VCD115) TaxID=546414 RepID=C1D1D1_DEIDV|nr:CoA transferase [Deinococcus deserti]ACO45655.1 putative CoA-transferase [Deinococcus deserti VCD115]
MSLPLSGLTVVSLALNLPGPLAAAELREEGARVIKVEPPAGDPLATLAPRWYEELHQGVERHQLDLKTGAGQAALALMLQEADVLLTSSRPSALKRLGLDGETLQECYPHLCRLRIVGDTREPDLPGHDLTYQAEAGLLDPRAPAMPRTLTADMLGSRVAVAAALTLLLGRERGSAERERTVGLGDAARFAALPLTHGLTAPGGILSGTHGTYRLYRTADGWVAAAPLEEHFARRWQDMFGEDATTTLICEPTRYWLELAQSHDLPLVQVPLESAP